MKKAYIGPQIAVEMFTPNTYVAACGDHGTVYKFKCDAGGGAYGGAWQETNGVTGLQTQRTWSYFADRRITYADNSYHACGETHEANATDDFIMNCYYKKSRDPDSKAVPVIVWRGPKGDNVHCTTNLNMSTWETAKS